MQCRIRITKRAGRLDCTSGKSTRRRYVDAMEWRGIQAGLQMRRVRQFPDRSALIETLVASCHIHFLLDGRPWTKLTSTEGEDPLGTFIAIDAFIFFDLKMITSEEAKIKYRMSTDTERKADITLVCDFDESLKNGLGIRDVISYEQGKVLRDRDTSIP